MTSLLKRLFHRHDYVEFVSGEGPTVRIVWYRCRKCGKETYDWGPLR